MAKKFRAGLLYGRTGVFDHSIGIGTEYPFAGLHISGKDFRLDDGNVYFQNPPFVSGQSVALSNEIYNGSYQFYNSNINLQSNRNYILKAIDESITATLPFNPSVGDFITILADVSGSYNVTINRNNEKLNSISENLLCDIDGHFILIYNGNDAGWKIRVLP